MGLFALSQIYNLRDMILEGLEVLVHFLLFCCTDPSIL